MNIYEQCNNMTYLSSVINKIYLFVCEFISLVNLIILCYCFNNLIKYILKLKLINLFKQISYIIYTKNLLLLYNALILPNYMYCLIIWGLLYKSNLNKIYIQQQQIIRLIINILKHIPNLYKLHSTLISHTYVIRNYMICYNKI